MLCTLLPQKTEGFVYNLAAKEKVVWDYICIGTVRKAGFIFSGSLLKAITLAKTPLLFVIVLALLLAGPGNGVHKV